MLVLSRCVNQQIVFPNIQVTLELLQVRGKHVKLGIQAPPGIRIVRPETCSVEELERLSRRSLTPVDRHQVRNRLNAINLAVHLFQKQIEAGLHEQAAVTFQRLTSEFSNLDGMFDVQPQPLPEVAAPRELQLLVVDDDENEREFLSGILKLHGFAVAEARDGFEALEYLSSHPRPDCVLLDIRMPKCDGLHALHSIRDDARLADLKVFAMTGTLAEDAPPLRAGGFDAWFCKPLDPERLIKAVERRDNVASA